MRPSGIRRPLARIVNLLPLVVYGGACAWFAEAAEARFSFPLDDAWIHQVYARSFAFGQGFAYNDGVQEAGSSSPLWVVVTAPAYLLSSFGTAAVVVAVKAIGVTLGLIAVVSGMRCAYLLAPARGTAAIAGSLLACEPRLLFSALSGMETCLLVSLWVGTALACLERHWWLAAVLLGLAPTARPEAVVLLPVGGLALLAGTRGWSVSRRLALGVLVVLPVAGWVVFNLAVQGHPLPNTFYAKAGVPEDWSHTLAVAWQVVTSHGFGIALPFALGVVGYVLLLLRGSIVLRLLHASFLLALPLAYIVAVGLSRHVDPRGYYWTRWLDPPAIVLAMAVCIGLAALLNGAAVQAAVARQARPTTVMLVAVACALGLLWSSPGLLVSLGDRRWHLASDGRAIDRTNVEAGRWIAEHTPRDAVVAVNDAGAIRYFGQRQTIDLGGLNTAEIAFGELNGFQALRRATHVAAFPYWVAPAGAVLKRDFEKAHRIAIPLDEYTICPCPGQTEIVIWRRKG